MLTPVSYYKLIETFPRSGCVICNLLLDDVAQQLESVLYEYVTDPEMQGNFRASRGLCNEHGWQLTTLRNALSIAVLYQAALDEILKIVRQKTSFTSQTRNLAARLSRKGVKHPLADALEPTQACIACQAQNENEAVYVGVLSEYIAEEQMQAAFSASDGLCLPHFTRTLQNTVDSERSRILIELQRDIWERLNHELLEFMRKNNAQHGAEPVGDERDSWKRAVARLGGEKGVFGNNR